MTPPAGGHGRLQAARPRQHDALEPGGDRVLAVQRRAGHAQPPGVGDAELHEPGGEGGRSVQARLADDVARDLDAVALEQVVHAGFGGNRRQRALGNLEVIDEEDRAPAAHDELIERVARRLGQVARPGDDEGFDLVGNLRQPVRRDLLQVVEPGELAPQRVAAAAARVGLRARRASRPPSCPGSSAAAAPRSARTRDSPRPG